MGERKVLNKYYAPDFDASRLPKVKRGAGVGDKPVTIRMMLPMSIKCETCGHFMGAGKKFNCRKETAKGLEYLSIKRYRFLIKCEVCKVPITFLTDPKNQDYEMESGATRNYNFNREANAAAAAEKEEAEKLAEADSMAKLESRTLESKREMDTLDQLDDIRMQNRSREKVDVNAVVDAVHGETVDFNKKRQEQQEDLAAVKEVFEKKRMSIKRLDEGKDEVSQPEAKKPKKDNLGLPTVVMKKRKKKKKKKAKKEEKKLVVGYGSSDSE